MRAESFNLKGLIENLILSADSIAFLRMEVVEDSLSEAYWAYYSVTSPSGEVGEIPVGIEFAHDESVLRLSVDVPVAVFDINDDEEMGGIRAAVDAANTTGWLISKTLLFVDEENDSASLDICYPFFIPHAHFRSAERFTLLRILVGYSLCRLIDESYSILRAVEERSQPRESSAEEAPRVLQ